MDNLLIALIVLCIHYGTTCDQHNNVCKTIHDYYIDLHHNPNCYHNPDAYLPVPEIVERHGYPIKNYSVLTADGYILTVFRIPHGKNMSKEVTRPPVFIQHGISVSSMPFVNIGGKSLAFVLADNGFDVWLGNFRGTEYSDKHLQLKVTDKQYWNFTFHENGVYDLPAQLNFIAKKTKEKLIYIGYSMGTTAYFIYNSMYPSIAQQQLRVAISMAPIAFLTHLETPVKKFVPLWPLVENIIYDTTDGVINRRTDERIARRRKRCLPYPFQMDGCLFAGFLLFGFDKSQENPETLPVVTMQDNDAIVIKTVSHYVQLILSGRFQEYDHGKNNVLVYGTKLPPQYNLSKINVPNYFIRANSDPLATRQNVEDTYSALPEAARPFDIYLVKNNKFTHADFLIAKDVKELVYNHVVNFLQNNIDALS